MAARVAKCYPHGVALRRQALVRPLLFALVVLGLYALLRTQRDELVDFVVPRTAVLALLIPPALCCLAWPPHPSVALTLAASSLIAACVGLRRPAEVVPPGVPDASLQAATDRLSNSITLNASLLDLGRFLHELRNAQSAIRLNLSYLKSAEGLDSESKEARR